MYFLDVTMTGVLWVRGAEKRTLRDAEPRTVATEPPIAEDECGSGLYNRPSYFDGIKASSNKQAVLWLLPDP
jgi:hypothetical protein